MKTEKNNQESETPTFNPSTVAVADLKIDKSIINAAKIPSLTDSVKGELQKKIEAEGVREPLTVWRGKNIIVDGIVRRDIYIALKIDKCPVNLVDFADKTAAIEYRVRQNFVRRHLNLWQRCRLAVELYIPTNSEKRANGQGDRYQDAANLAGASLDTISKVNHILTESKNQWTEARREEYLKQLEEGNKAIYNVWSELKQTNDNSSGGNGKSDTNDESFNTITVKPPRCKNVDNKIVVGDCTASVKLIPTGAATIYVFSPPYLSANKDYDGTFNDRCEYETYLTKLRELFAEIPRTLRDGGMVAVNIDNVTSHKNKREQYYRYPCNADIVNIMRDAGLLYFDELIWEKNVPPGNRPTFGDIGSIRFSHVHEYVILASKGEPFIDNIELDKLDLTNEEQREWHETVWGITAASRKQANNHPCPYPQQLVYRLIKLFSFQNDLVVDPFLGSGTTALVARKCNRRYFGCDINADYVAKAIKRVADCKQGEWVNGVKE